MTPIAGFNRSKSYVVNRPGRRIVRVAGMAVLTMALFLGLGQSSAYAARDGIDPNTEMDARLFGYERTVGIEKDSTAPLWFVYFFLVVVGCSALFKTAKRE